MFFVRIFRKNRSIQFAVGKYCKMEQIDIEATLQAASEDIS